MAILQGEEQPLHLHDTVLILVRGWIRGKRNQDMSNIEGYDETPRRFGDNLEGKEWFQRGLGHSQAKRGIPRGRVTFESEARP
jgi:hypothetical protein